MWHSHWHDCLKRKIKFLTLCIADRPKQRLARKTRCAHMYTISIIICYFYATCVLQRCQRLYKCIRLAIHYSSSPNSRLDSGSPHPIHTLQSRICIFHAIKLRYAILHTSSVQIVHLAVLLKELQVYFFLFKKIKPILKLHLYGNKKVLIQNVSWRFDIYYLLFLFFNELA